LGGQGGYANISGIAKELIDDMIAFDAAIPGRYRCSFDPEFFKYLSLKKLLAEDVKVLFYTTVADVIRDQDRFTGALIESKNGREAVFGRVVIDATGDADAAARAGAKFVVGRERDGKMRPIGLMFRIGNVDVSRLLRYCESHPEEFAPDPSKNIMDLTDRYPVFRPLGFYNLVKKGKAEGRLPQDCHYLRFDSLDMKRGVLTVNNVRVYNVDGTQTQDLVRADIEAREQMYQLLKFIQEEVPGCESCYLIDSGSNLGVRETRRIIGDYILTERDIVAETDFPDTICRVGLRSAPHVEVHSPDAGEADEKDLHYREYVDDLHVIRVPYRCLLPKGIEGLLVAGRCISADHQADGWTRVQPVCFLTGQAAGLAAAQSVRKDIPLRDIDTDELRQSLREVGVDL
jgi:hypothetical protein